MRRILIAGGDMRQIYCAQELSREFEVCVTGTCFAAFGEGTAVRPADDSGDFDYAVLPVLPPDENGIIHTPLSDTPLSAGEVRRMLKKGGTVFVGTGAERYAGYFPENRVVSYMDCESLSLKNAIPSAEGAVQIALEELPVTLNGLSVLIAGLGRIGTSLALILKGFGAEVTAAVRSAEGEAKARMLGIKSVRTQAVGGGYGLVFNTVPKLIFDRDMLMRFAKDTLFIDLASRPGGFDREAAEELCRRVIAAPGLPGKTAPKTAGKAEAETVFQLIIDN